MSAKQVVPAARTASRRAFKRIKSLLFYVRCGRVCLIDSFPEITVALRHVGGTSEGRRNGEGYYCQDKDLVSFVHSILLFREFYFWEFASLRSGNDARRVFSQL